MRRNLEKRENKLTIEMNKEEEEEEVEEAKGSDK